MRSNTFETQATEIGQKEPEELKFSYCVNGNYKEKLSHGSKGMQRPGRIKDLKIYIRAREVLQYEASGSV